MVQLLDSFLASPESADICQEFPVEVERKHSKLLSTVTGAEIDLSLTIDRVTLANNSLARCRAAVVKKEDVLERPVAYFWDDGLLMRKRMPGLRSDVVKYCQSCHTCQIVGKPNQSISPAPLCPIPVVGEPFEWVILDCVGPLPRTMSGHKFILTMMCSNTRLPEAVPLRTINTKGILFYLQTDQGTNFMSRLFKQVLSQLNIKHEVSSAYHPESQGALERFHQTLKSMLRTFCAQSEKEWDEGLTLLLFAVRETQ